MQLTQHIIKNNYKNFIVFYNGKDNYKDNDNFCCGNSKNSKGGGITENEDPEKYQYYYHSDHLGSASYITNLDGDIVQHVEYVSFGEVFLEEKNNKWNTPYLFNGKELDEETGLYYYYGARYYAAWLGRWTAVDPLKEKYQNLSPYNYVANNPINSIDPDGRKIVPHDNDEAVAYNNYKRTIDDRVQAYDDKTQSLREKGTKSSVRRADKREGKRVLNEYVKIQQELNMLDNADEVFRIRMGKNITSSTEGGNFVYNKETMEFDVNVDIHGDFSKVSRIAHELKHAYQYLEGKIGFDLKKPGNLAIPFAYDFMDEVEAYNRQGLFGVSLSEEQICERYKFSRQTQETVREHREFKSILRANRGYYIVNQSPKILYNGWEKDL